MIQEDLLVKVIDRLNQVNIPYMITGGIATIFYGRPRLTHDFDIVIDVGPEQIQRLIDTFGEEFYVSEEAVREAMDRHGMFNLIHLDSGIKVDSGCFRTTHLTGGDLDEDKDTSIQEGRLSFLHLRMWFLKSFYGLKRQR